MITKSVVTMVAAAFSLLAGDSCFAREALFYKASRNYDEEGPLASVFRRELETRLFTHASWSERLYLSYDNPDIDYTIEVYSRADGSPWLNYRRAVPSISRLIRTEMFIRRDVTGLSRRSVPNFDLKKELDAVQIIDHEVALPKEVASEIKLLWRTMLSDLPKPPPEGPQKQGEVATHTIYLNVVVIIAFAKQDNTVKTGSIPMNLHKTRAYREFGAIVDDFVRVSERGAGAGDPIWAQLTKRMRNLRFYLKGQKE